MKRFALIFLIILIPRISEATYALPVARSVTWAGNAGLGYCSDTQWYSKTLCEADGDTWSTTIPERLTIYATIQTADQGDDTSAITTALSNCPAGQTVLLGPGVFTTTNLINVPSNVTLRGSGVDVTTIKNQSSVTFVVGLAGRTSGGWTDTDIGITAPSKGDTVITTSSPHGASVGDIIVLDQLENASADPPTDVNGNHVGETGRDSNTRTVSQVVRVVAVGDTTHFTIETPIMFNFDSGQTPQMYNLTAQGMTEMAGIEDLTADSTDSTYNDNYGQAWVSFSTNCWIKNVKLYKIGRGGLRIRGTYRNYVYKNIVNDTRGATGPNSGYLLWVSYNNSGLLIENSIYSDGVDTVWTGGNVGNVFAYNYLTDMHNDTYADDMGKGTFFHGAFPQFNLFEGNYWDTCVGAAGDTEYGASGFNTYFANKFKADTNGGTFADLLANIALIEGYYFNFVGNVIGTNGFETVYQSTSNDDIYDGVKMIYHHQNSGNANELRHRNYDFVNDDVLTCVEGDATPPIADCQGGTTDTDLPDSLYLTSKPSWMGNNTHPWVIAATGAADPTDLSAYVKYTTGSWIDDAPSILNIVVDANGQTVTLTASEALTQGVGYADSHLSMNCPSDADIGFTYVSGNTTSSLIYSTDHTVLDSDGNNCVFNFTGTANSLEDGDGNDLPAIVSQSVDNNSSQGATANTGRVMVPIAGGHAGTYNANGYQLVAP
ncbi:MAG: hypothetical protein ACU83N_09985 [Gammaproteobacteria bacterium]